MMIKSFLALIFTLLAVLHAAETPAQRPNVLLLIADDLNLALGCYGDIAARTPNVDRLAAEGARFTRAYGQGAVCTPSRNSFLTGLSTRTVGIHTKFVEYQRRDPQATSLGRHFRRNGYQTAGFGKIAHTLEHEDPEAWDIRDEGVAKSPVKAREERRDDRTGAQTYRNITEIYADDVKTTDAFRADRFAQFLAKERAPGKPFLAAVGFHSPHEPHMVYQRNLDAVALTDMALLRQPDGASPSIHWSLIFYPGIPTTRPSDL